MGYSGEGAGDGIEVVDFGPDTNGKGFFRYRIARHPKKMDLVAEVEFFFKSMLGSPSCISGQSTYPCIGLHLIESFIGISLTTGCELRAKQGAVPEF